ncbi:hypothetical protein BpHYR1_016474 [Brachionus plicatilis]|uniref:Uncharacterized protein n=1 Tax=Brachionus plicatilis TaxID=10195 RepID=A0A3M7Q0A7_BRAPC|nr:hypothetical protein BpHYR1_016474 [Brachionus plicatilis]
MIHELSENLNKLSMDLKCGQITISQEQKPMLCLNNFFLARTGLVASKNVKSSNLDERLK